MLAVETTIRLDDHLLVEVKQLAAQSGRTMTAIIEDALRELLARRQQMAQEPPVRLPTFGGKGLFPGVDLDDSQGLLDLMDR